MSISEPQKIEGKINYWKKKLIGESNKNPLVDLRQNQNRLGEHPTFYLASKD